MSWLSANRLSKVTIAFTQLVLQGTFYSSLSHPLVSCGSQVTVVLRFRLLCMTLADFIPSVRKLIAKAEAPPKKKKADTPPPPKITHGQVWVSQQFVGWQEAVLRALQVGGQPVTSLI